jgi:hypothetical protein
MFRRPYYWRRRWGVMGPRPWMRPWGCGCLPLILVIGLVLLGIIGIFTRFHF